MIKIWIFGLEKFFPFSEQQSWSEKKEPSLYPLLLQRSRQKSITIIIERCQTHNMVLIIFRFGRDSTSLQSWELALSDWKVFFPFSEQHSRPRNAEWHPLDAFSWISRTKKVSRLGTAFGTILPSTIVWIDIGSANALHCSLPPIISSGTKFMIIK